MFVITRRSRRGRESRKSKPKQTTVGHDCEISTVVNIISTKCQFAQRLGAQTDREKRILTKLLFIGSKSKSTSSSMVDVDNVTESGDFAPNRTAGVTFPMVQSQETGESKEKSVDDISFDLDSGSILVSTNYKIDPDASVMPASNDISAPVPKNLLTTEINFDEASSTSSWSTPLSSQSALLWSNITLTPSKTFIGAINNPTIISNTEPSINSRMDPIDPPNQENSVFEIQTNLKNNFSTSSSTLPLPASSVSPSSSSSSQPTLKQSSMPALKKKIVETSTNRNPTLSNLKAPSDKLLSQIPLMNSMVRYQLQRLLKAREETRKKFPRATNLNRPVAVLTAYSVKKIPSDGLFESQTGSKLYHKIPDKVFYGNFLPVVCEHLSAIIHLDKLYCPGTYRPCVEFEGTLISPLNLLQKAGFTYTANWEAIFRVGGGKSIKMLFDNSKLNFKNHNNFCSGRCQRHSSA